MCEQKKLNPDVNAFQRKFIHEVRRCDEMERKLRTLDKCRHILLQQIVVTNGMTHSSSYFSFLPSPYNDNIFNEGFVEREIKKDEIPVNDLDENSEAPAPREMVELESTFEKLEYELKEVIGSRDELKRTFLDLTQLKCILQKAQIFFQQVRRRMREVKQLLFLQDAVLS